MEVAAERGSCQGVDVAETREYRSPLRAAQAERTRELILDAVAELVAEDGFEQLSVREVATRCGIAERTVYRHFSDRAALEDALTDRVSKRYDWGRRLDELLTDLESLPAAMQASYEAFDREAQGTRVVAKMLAASSRSAADSRRRGEAMQRIVDEELPHLDPTDRRVLAGLFQVLGSSRTWLRLVDDFDVSGEEAGRVIRWLLDLAVGALTSGSGIDDDRE